MVEEKAYYRYVEKQSQRQGHLGETRVHMTLSQDMCGEGKRKEWGTRCNSQDAQKNKERW